MYIRLKTSSASRNPTVQIIESYREGDKVKQRIVASLGVVKDDEDKQRLILMAQALINKLSPSQPFLSGFEAVEVTSSKKNNSVDPRGLIHVRNRISGFQEVYGELLKKIGFQDEFYNLDKTHNHDFALANIIPMLVEKRLFHPVSKRRSLFLDTLEQGAVPFQLHQVYRALDIVIEGVDQFQKIAWNAGVNLFNKPIDCLFYDATTLYFESVSSDELKNFGFSKDCKFNQVQVMFCLMVTTEGIPVGYEVFSGNTHETRTLQDAVENISSRVNVNRVTIVCDRGMLSKDNLGYANNTVKMKYIIGEKLRKLPQKNHEEIFNLDLYDAVGENFKIKDIPHPTRKDARLILAYSSDRAKKDKADRERLIKKLDAKLSKKKNSPKDFVSNCGVKKFVTISGGSVILNREAILKDEKWDGFFGIVTNHNKEELGSLDILSHYRGLWQVEAAFRVSKHNLSARPIYHWTSKRIKAHLLICFLALVLERHLEALLKNRNTPLTTTQIHDALSGCQKIIFQDQKTYRLFEMDTNKSIEAKQIYEAIGLKWRQSTRELPKPDGIVVPSSLSVNPQAIGII